MRKQVCFGFFLAHHHVFVSPPSPLPSLPAPSFPSYFHLLLILIISSPTVIAPPTLMTTYETPPVTKVTVASLSLETLLLGYAPPCCPAGKAGSSCC